MNLSYLKTKWVDSANIKQLKSKDIDLTWEVYKTNKWPKSMCKAEWQINETANLEVHYQDSKQQRFE